MSEPKGNVKPGDDWPDKRRDALISEAQRLADPCGGGEAYLLGKMADLAIWQEGEIASARVYIESLREQVRRLVIEKETLLLMAEGRGISLRDELSREEPDR